MIRRTHAHAEVPMPRLLPALAVSALVLAGCGGGDEKSGSSSAGGSDAVEVKIASFDFMPKTAKVKAGGAITWTNEDKALHNAQTDNGAKGAFNTKDLKTGDAKKLTFDEPGTYSYYCVYHRFMTGKVEVTR